MLAKNYLVARPLHQRPIDLNSGAPLIGTEAFEAHIDMFCDGAGSGLKPALKLLLQSPFRHYTVDALAKVAGMSRSGFAQHFADCFGEGPMAWLKRERLRYAEHLLVSTQLPIKIVAMEVGYSSRSHFSRTFQAATGMSPQEVRLRGPAKQRDRSKKMRDLRWSHSLDEDAVDAIFDLDLVAQTVWLSEGNSRLLGLGPDCELTIESWVELLHPDDKLATHQGITAATQGSADRWSAECRFKPKDRDYVRVVYRGQIVRDPIGAALRIHGLVLVKEWGKCPE